METEYEAKFYPVDKKLIRKRLASIGAKLVYPERKMRRAIADVLDNRELKCDYIRVRDEGDVVRMSAKIHAREDGKVSDQKEVDVIVEHYEKAIELLKMAGIKINRFQETLRETWELQNSEIVIDTWPGLKPYVEIETVSEEELRNIAELLGFDWERKIITGITDVYMQVYKISRKEVLKKISNITFENNPYGGMKQHKMFD